MRCGRVSETCLLGIWEDPEVRPIMWLKGFGTQWGFWEREGSWGAWELRRLAGQYAACWKGGGRDSVADDTDKDMDKGAGGREGCPLAGR